jgi:uncharacterized protein (TIGR01777 family)
MARARVFEWRSEIPASAGELFRAHRRPGAFERLMPPWERAELVAASPALAPGAWVELRGVGPLRARWVAEIASVDDEGEAGGAFVDRAVEGPFARWEHRHVVRALAPRRSELLDRVEYALPLGPLGGALAGSVRRRLGRAFAYRHRVTAADLARHAAFADRPRLDVLVSGASGMVGSALCAFLLAGGHRVRRLVRGAPRGADEFRWDTLGGTIDPAAAEGADAVVHLAGESIAAGRWTPERKDKIRRSRREGTRHVADAVRAARAKPRVFVSASAIGIYGDRGDEELDESSPEGSGFLADVCREWERAARDLCGIRAVQLRFGMILSPSGGALRRMLLPFRLGLGGPVGSGRQWVSWIALDDVLYAIHHALWRDDLSGPANALTPNPVRNREFGRTLGRVLRRPAFAPFPSLAARALFGELARDLLLASCRARPARLEQAGFRFSYPELEGALRHVLGRWHTSVAEHPRR